MRVNLAKVDVEEIGLVAEPDRNNANSVFLGPLGRFQWKRVMVFAFKLIKFLIKLILTEEPWLFHFEEL